VLASLPQLLMPQSGDGGHCVHGTSVAHDAFAGIGLRDYGSVLSQPQNKPRKTLSVDRISYDQSPMGSIITSILFADAVIFIATYVLANVASMASLTIAKCCASVKCPYLMPPGAS